MVVVSSGVFGPYTKIVAPVITILTVVILLGQLQKWRSYDALKFVDWGRNRPREPFSSTLRATCCRLSDSPTFRTTAALAVVSKRVQYEDGL